MKKNGCIVKWSAISCFCLLLLAVLSGGCLHTDARILEKKTESIVQNNETGTKPQPQGYPVSSDDTFSRYFSLTPLNVTPQVPAYTIPLKNDEIANYESVSTKLSFADNHQISQKISENGFVVIRNPLNPQEEDIVKTYKKIQEQEIPVFITSDSILHLYHSEFDETLREIEERELYSDLWDVNRNLLNESVASYNSSTGIEREAAARNAAYFAVALTLLKPRPDQIAWSGFNDTEAHRYESRFSERENRTYTFELPDFIKNETLSEISQINGHPGFAPSPLFHYREDYSQYIPRGHYTRSELLRNYFKAMMWNGRMTFLLNADPDCIVGITAEDADIQTTGALLITTTLERKPEIKEKWERITTITEFFAGTSDDLGPAEYRNAMDSVIADNRTEGIFSDTTVKKVRSLIMTYLSPKIYSGTGEVTALDPEEGERCLEATKGFHLFGQKFTPDSYMFSNLVGEQTGKYTGSGQPFTMVMTGNGPIRGLPRGLDVMAVLGSDRAFALLEASGDTHYSRYDHQYEYLKQQISAMTENDWHQNLYLGWMDCIKTLLKPSGAGYPTFMQTDGWKDKELNTALSS